MVILHFILGKANPNRANGVNQVIYGLAKYQSLQGHKVYVVGISKSMTERFENVDRKYFNVEAFHSFKHDGFKRIKVLALKVDIVHLHGVWNMFNIKVGIYLESIKKPYVITAHCGYAIDRLKQSNYWLKLGYHYLWQKHLYEHASGIHALTREESTDIAKLCMNKNIFVVNNGVDTDTFDKFQYKLHNRKKVRFGYLGRISEEKNIDNLIRAFALLPNNLSQEVELCMIGPINSDAKKLQNYVTKLGLSHIVKFVGSKYGMEKINALLDLDVYIHPAKSDVVGIAVMEALALGLPSIVTRTSHMSYFYKSEAFIMVEPTSFDLCRGIQEILLNKAKWNVLSNNAKFLYRNTFNWKVVVENLIEQYEKIILL